MKNQESNNIQIRSKSSKIGHTYWKVGSLYPWSLIGLICEPTSGMLQMIVNARKSDAVAVAATFLKCNIVTNHMWSRAG